MTNRMTSHQLAHYLLARRDNDIQVEVYVETEPDKQFATYVHLRDDTEFSNLEPRPIPSENVVVYDSDADCIIVRAGLVITHDTIPED